MVILNWTKLAILLFDKEEGRCERGFGGTNIAMHEHIVQEGI